MDLSNFLSQNKCPVGKVCKNRCPAVDISNFLSKKSYQKFLIDVTHIQCDWYLFMLHKHTQTHFQHYDCVAVNPKWKHVQIFRAWKNIFAHAY